MKRRTQQQPRASIEWPSSNRQAAQKNTSSFAARNTSPPQQTNSSLNHNNKPSITWPLWFDPQHETTPPLDSAQECNCKQNVTIPRPPPHKPQTSSRNNSNHSITSTQPIQSPRTAATCLPNTAATRQSKPPSYPAQSKHRNATAQTNNSHGRRSIGSRAIAELQVENKSSARHASPPQQTNSSLNHNNKHHLAIFVRSPARHRAAARQRTGMILKTSRHNAPRLFTALQSVK